VKTPPAPPSSSSSASSSQLNSSLPEKGRRKSLLAKQAVHDDSRSRLYSHEAPSPSKNGVTNDTKLTWRDGVEQEARARFAISAKEGVAVMTNAGIIENSPSAIAKWLWESGESLDAAQKGEMIGGDSDFNQEVLAHFIGSQEFKHLGFDAAVRATLATFRLPGEGQKIERIMEAFAKHYVASNPGSFVSTDAAFSLAFAIIMLNTELHNEQALRIGGRPVMTEEKWISLVDETTDSSIDHKILHELFESIRRDPILQPDEMKGKKEQGLDEETASPARKLGLFLKKIFVE
jgi:Sec7-like guanine-nucleotide exchange factor